MLIQFFQIKKKKNLSSSVLRLYFNFLKKTIMSDHRCQVNIMKYIKSKKQVLQQIVEAILIRFSHKSKEQCRANL